MLGFRVLVVCAARGRDAAVEVAYPNGSTLADKLTTNAGDWPVAVSPDNALGT
jgi:hypothetical protein